MPFASRFNASALVLVSLFLTPTLAFAHPGSSMLATGWTGFLHPLTGLDHFLAMVAVGLWAAHLRGRAPLALPIAFPLAMIAGASLAVSGWMLPAVEQTIAISVVVLGAVVASGVRVPLLASMAIVAMFAVFHGHAHATEAAGNLAAYGVGFTLATIALHILGMLAGAVLVTRRRALMIGGTAITTVGLALLFA
jgi:urease accessory protein